MIKDKLASLLAPAASFLVPEPILSAKLIFDNVRNYVVVGALFAVASWLQSGGVALDNPFFKPRFGGQQAFIHSWIFWTAVSLFAVNVLQSLELGRRALEASIRSFEKLQNHLTAHESILVSVGVGFTALLSFSTFLLLAALAIPFLLLVFAAIVTHIGFASAV
jgi:hypothetical protein